MATQDVISGLFKNRVTSPGAYALMCSDSTSQWTQQWSIMGTLCVRATAAGIVCLGGASGMISSTGAGWPVQSGEWAGTNVTSEQKRPGELVTADGSSGNSIRNTRYANFTGDYANFGTPTTISVRTVGSTVWSQSVNTRIPIVARTTTSPRGPASWRIQAFNRANVQTGGDVTINLNQAAAIRVFSGPTIAMGTGATDVNGKFSAWNENESGWQAQLLSWGVQVVGGTTGIYYGYCGHGSWTSKNHASATGQSITADPPTYTGAYSHDAMVAEILAHRWDTFMYHAGTNASEDGVGVYQAEVEAWRTRWKAASDAARVTDPTIKTAIFMLLSPYATTGTTSYWDALRLGLKNVALAHLADTEYIDLCQYVYDTYGTYAAYQANLLRDGVHPKSTLSPLFDANDTLRNALADRILAVGMGPSVGLPGGFVNESRPSIAIGVCL